MFFNGKHWKKRQNSSNKLLTTIAYQLDDVCYALEGSIFMAGANFQWLRDKMNFFEDVEESEELAKKADPNANVYPHSCFCRFRSSTLGP